MTKKISETKPVLEFKDTATLFCIIIENRHGESVVRFLQKTLLILPKLCSSAMLLPDIERIGNYESPRISHEQWNELFKSLHEKLEKYDTYKEMFDPYEKEEEPVNMSIADHLSDLYLDLKAGLADWERASRIDRLGIIWHWKWGFENYWGDRAVSVFRAIYSLLYVHIENKYGDYIGLNDYD